MLLDRKWWVMGAHFWSVCVFVYLFYRFFKLLGLRTCQYNISIMIKVKLELNRVEVEIGDHLGISFAHFLAICLAASKVSTEL